MYNLSFDSLFSLHLCLRNPPDQRRYLYSAIFYFQFHRFFMGLTWGLTIAGVVLIAYYLKGWTELDPKVNPHAILGIVSTGELPSARRISSFVLIFYVKLFPKQPQSLFSQFVIYFFNSRFVFHSTIHGSMSLCPNSPKASRLQLASLVCWQQRTDHWYYSDLLWA